MKMKRSIIVIALVIAGCVCGADEVESLRDYVPAESIILSSTNLLIKFKASGVGRRIIQKEKNVRRFSEHGEELALTPDYETCLSDGRHALTVFTPVLFKSLQKGFKISHELMGAFSSQVPSVISYIALSDTPIQVGEDDVKMIMENGEWKKYEKPQPVILPREDAATSPPAKKEGPAAVSPPSRKENETPATVVEVEQSKHNNLWLYVGIVFCLLPILYFLLRKFSNH